VIQQFLSKQFILFLVTGGTAALVNFGSRIVYNQWVSFSVAIVLAYLTGMVTAFLLARWLVFKQSEQSFARSAMMFGAVNVIAVFQTWLITMGLACMYCRTLALRCLSLKSPMRLVSWCPYSPVIWGTKISHFVNTDEIR
jgi:putative flippase GtrA